MTPLSSNIAILAAMVVCPGISPAAIIYSGSQNITIPFTFEGVYLDLETSTTDGTEISSWDLNFFFGGEGIGASDSLNPVKTGTTALDPVRALGVGSSVGENTSSYRAGFNGSSTHLGDVAVIVSADKPGAHLSRSSNQDEVPTPLTSAPATDLSFSNITNNMSVEQFTPNVPGYLGFRFTPEGSSDILYGWMQVTLNNNGDPGTIHDWAWEDSGASILVGNIPEPSVPLLLFGASLAILIRRRSTT